MKIEQKGDPILTRIEEVHYGDAVRHAGKNYILTSIHKDARTLVLIDLDTGAATNMPWGTEIEVLNNAKVVL